MTRQKLFIGAGLNPAGKNDTTEDTPQIRMAVICKWEAQ